MNILEIIEAAEAKGVTHFGIRQHHTVVKVGDELGVSYNTLDDAEAERLTGLCCIMTSYDGFDIDFDYDLESIDSLNHQDGSTVLVGGVCGYEGNDSDEIIIEDAVALWVR